MYKEITASMPLLSKEQVQDSLDRIMMTSVLTSIVRNHRKSLPWYSFIKKSQCIKTENNASSKAGELFTKYYKFWDVDQYRKANEFMAIILDTTPAKLGYVEGMSWVKNDLS